MSDRVRTGHHSGRVACSVINLSLPCGLRLPGHATASKGASGRVGDSRRPDRISTNGSPTRISLGTPQCDCKHAAHQYGYKLCGHLGHVFRGQLTSTVWGSNPKCMHWTQLAHQYGLGLQSQSNAPVPHSWYLAPCPSQNCLPTYLMREANRGDQRRSEAVGGRISCTHPPIHRTWARSEAEAESAARTLPIHRTWVRPRHRKRRALDRSGRRSEEHP